MNIAVTYDNGQIFQHFGHTEEFKLYEIDGRDIVNTEVLATEGAGHGALGGWLRAHDVDVLICVYNEPEKVVEKTVAAAVSML